MVGPSLPLLHLPRVWHVGQMNSTLKGTTHNRYSHEGNGLSVSTHPQAWRQIARLGGCPTWELRLQAGPCAFADAHAMKEQDWAPVVAWGIDQGLVRYTKCAALRYFDDELDDEVEILTELLSHTREAQLEEIRQEAAGRGAACLLREEIAGTATLAARMGHGDQVQPPLARDLLLVAYAEDLLHDHAGVVGVWWKDVLDPTRHSAPRGVLTLRALQDKTRWSISRTEPESARLAPAESFAPVADRQRG